MHDRDKQLMKVMEIRRSCILKLNEEIFQSVQVSKVFLIDLEK